MRTEKILKRPMVSFILLSNVILWVILALTGVCMMLGAPKVLLHILPMVAAWSSTFALIILFKKIYPGLKFKEFVKKQFAPKLRFSTFGAVIIIQVLIFVVTMFLLLSTKNIQNLTLSFSSVGMLLFGFFDHLLRGPLGEELGWRGYALSELQKKYSPLRSALIVGVVWGLWHAPIWPLTSGYTGVNFIKYCIFFMIAIVSVNIMITFFYNLNNNLLIPILIHQLFNFLFSITKVELLDILLYTTISYFIVAVALIVTNPKQILYEKS